MKTFAVLSALVGAALAQSSVSSAAGATSTSNPLIPSGISSTCSDYLQQLNSNSTLSACTSSIITATSSFSPTSSDSSSSSSVNSALNQLCSSSSCTASTVRSLLADFYSACSAELGTNLNQDVLRQYDVLYSLIPFQQAVCSQDSSGNYCVLSMPSTTSSASSASASASAGVKDLLASTSNGASDLTNDLYSTVSKRSLIPRDQTTLIVPNTTTFGSTNLLFLFLNSDMTSSELCTSSCTSSIMSAYINFESNVPYGPGLANSALLSGQSALYTRIQSECGSSFLSGTVQAAGGISAGIAHSGAVSSVTLGFGGIFATALAAIAASLA